MSIEITDDDIAYAEKLLLPPGSRFNEERRRFIRCLESRDVVACPGSGKTTALLAKLLVLSKKMPLADGRGICVLTHTNVGIDKIKEKADIASSTLFRYPNFFGTIQSFVNQFLAAPWYRSEYKVPLITIENDRFYWELKKIYSQDYGLQSWLEPRGGLEKLGSYWFNPNTMCVGESLDAPISKLSESTITFNKIQSIRRILLDRGILSYNDAYAIGLRYLLKMADVSEAVSNRFYMVFLDETQDTDEHQFRVLDALFREEQLIIQRIGDPNQAIYHDSVQKGEYWSPRNPLHFSDSRRYGETITRLLSTVRVDDRIALQSCELTNSCPLYLILFREGEEQEVIHAFSYLIEELLDRLPSNGMYKAVGWIGKDKTQEGKLCIPAYFPQFDRSSNAQSRSFSNLISYIAYAIQMASLEGAKYFLEIILQGITRALDVAGIKDETSGRNYSPITLDHFWKRGHEKSYYEFREQVSKYFLLALDSSITPTEIRDKTRFAIQSVWHLNGKATTFLNDDKVDAILVEECNTTAVKNQFIADNGITINIGTVHSVKGETHTATLYMETDYQREADAKRLIEFLKGNRPGPQLRKVYHRQNLKIAHVAFSRPTHLLAFACRAASIAGCEGDLKKNGWIIRTVAELINEKGGVSIP